MMSLNTHLQNDPNQNYDKFEKLLLHAKTKQLTTKTIQFYKYKHKQSKWITNGILKSINTKDKLYKALVKTVCTNSTLYNNFKTKFKTYKTILRKTVREAKRFTTIEFSSNINIILNTPDPLLNKHETKIHNIMIYWLGLFTMIWL